MKFKPLHFVAFFALIMITFWAGNYLWAFIPFSTGTAFIDSIVSSLFVVGIFYLVWFKWGAEKADEL